MKLWQMLYGNLMEENNGGEGGGGGATPPAGNPQGNIGEADYLNTPNDANQPAPKTEAKPAEDDPDKKLDFNNGEGLLDLKTDGDSDDNPDDDPTKQSDKDPAPADADYKFDLPEGFILDDDVKQSVIDLAKESGVTPDVANKFVQKHAELKQQELETAKATIEDWRKQTLADPEVGGDFIQQTMKNVNTALAAPSGNEFAEILKQTGLQNHPAVVKFLNHYGKMVKTDSVKGVTPVTEVSDKQKLDDFYGNPN